MVFFFKFLLIIMTGIYVFHRVHINEILPISVFCRNNWYFMDLFY